MEKRFCTKCGSELQSDVAFCPSCGNPVVNNVSEQATTSTPNVEQSTVTTTNTDDQKKIHTYLTWGWITSVLSLFVPILGVCSIVLGVFTIKKNKTTAGTVLIIFSVIFMYLGMTGFGSGFFGAFQ